MARAACPQARCDLAPSDCSETLPLLQAPLDGTPWTGNLFDHQYPRSFSDPDSAFASYCGGGNRAGGINGHNGYDWVVPVGTPLLAVADGTINFAGAERSFFCPLLSREVSGLWMQLETRSPHGERFWAQYGHLSQLVAVTGQSVRAGDTIGLSGNTGCSTGPHLHLQVLREFTNQERGFGVTSAEVLDPYGWQGQGKDPWASEPEGASSAWLWIQPPRLRRLPVPSPGATAQPDIRDMNNFPRPLITR
jgi:murein DD-endopeptidase MepM/ murein hydrolase activator NlpD